MGAIKATFGILNKKLDDEDKEIKWRDNTKEERGRDKKDKVDEMQRGGLVISLTGSPGSRRCSEAFLEDFC